MFNTFSDTTCSELCWNNRPGPNFSQFYSIQSVIPYIDQVIDKVLFYFNDLVLLAINKCFTSVCVYLCIAISLPYTITDQYEFPKHLCSNKGMYL